MEMKIKKVFLHGMVSEKQHQHKKNNCPNKFIFLKTKKRNQS